MFLGKSRGSVSLEKLGGISFSFVYVPGEETAMGELTISGGLIASDEEHRIAAHILSRQWRVVVIWQDETGLKHFVRPDEPLLTERERAEKVALGKRLVLEEFRGVRYALH